MSFFVGIVVVPIKKLAGWKQVFAGGGVYFVGTGLCHRDANNQRHQPQPARSVVGHAVDVCRLLEKKN